MQECLLLSLTLYNPALFRPYNTRGGADLPPSFFLFSRGAPKDGDPNQAQASVTDTGSGSGTPASECAQVKVAGVHRFSCTPYSIAKTWVRTLVVLILTK